VPANTHAHMRASHTPVSLALLVVAALRLGQEEATNSAAVVAQPVPAGLPDDACHCCAVTQARSTRSQRQGEPAGQCRAQEWR